MKGGERNDETLKHRVDSKESNGTSGETDRCQSTQVRNMR